MKKFENGVRYFTRGMVSVHFPEDDVACVYCPMMGAEMKNERRYCRRTGEYLPAYEHSIGLDCPIKFEEETE